MKRVLVPFTLVILFTVSAARADSLLYAVNNGLGDNFAYIGEMDGHRFVLTGGTNPWFFGNGGYYPGSILGGQTELFLYTTTVWVSGAPVDLSFPSPSATLFMSSFTLPTNGRDFRVFVQLGFSAAGVNWELPQLINLSGSAQGWINFYFSNGLYYPSDFVPATVPEPATLAFLCTGTAGILAAMRRKFKA